MTSRTKTRRAMQAELRMSEAWRDRSVEISPTLRFEDSFSLAIARDATAKIFPTFIQVFALNVFVMRTSFKQIINELNQTDLLRFEIINKIEINFNPLRIFYGLIVGDCGWQVFVYLLSLLRINHKNSPSAPSIEFSHNFTTGCYCKILKLF